MDGVTAGFLFQCVMLSVLFGYITFWADKAFGLGPLHFFDFPYILMMSILFAIIGYWIDGDAANGLIRGFIYGTGITIVNPLLHLRSFRCSEDAKNKKNVGKQ